MHMKYNNKLSCSVVSRSICSGLRFRKLSQLSHNIIIHYLGKIVNGFLAPLPFGGGLICAAFFQHRKRAAPLSCSSFCELNLYRM